jgi:hypothetical protein
MKNWQRYERAMFNELYYIYRPPRFMVKPDARDIVGLLSQETRQIDVAVFEQGDMERPFLAVECKHHKRRLNIKDVEAFVGMRDDIGAKNAMLVCPVGFSRGASIRAERASIVTHKLPAVDAERLNLRELVRQTFPWDETFHPVMGDALFAFDRSSSLDDWIESVEELPFEEWEDTFETFARLSANKCQDILRAIAQLHWDDGWRFNAIRLLGKFGWIDETFCAFLFGSETDADTRELLESVTDSER